MPREIFDIGSIGTQIGKQILGGQAAYEDAYTKMGQALAAQAAQQAQARLHTLQGDDIVAANEARKPANLTRIAANLAGLTDPQGDAMHSFISSGSWGKAPEALPSDFIGPPQTLPLPKPEWATPDVMNRVGQYVGALRTSGALPGKTDFSNLVQGLKGVWDQGMTDRALAGQLPIESIRNLNALDAAKKGSLYNFHEFGTGDQATGGVSFNQPYLKKNDAEIKAKDAAALASRGSAANAFANADLHRAQIPLAQANTDLARSRINAPQIIQNPDGTTTILDPKAKPLTESQAKATVYLGQMKAAEDALGGIEKDQSKIGTQLDVSAAGSLVNVAASPSAQKIRQAQEQWAEAFLRLKSGAAVTEAEVRRNAATFFPRVGDSRAVIEQKRMMREQAINDVAAAAGPGAATVRSVYSGAGVMGNGKRPPIQRGQVVDGYQFMGGDPSVAENWRRVQ